MNKEELILSKILLLIRSNHEDKLIPLQVNIKATKFESEINKESSTYFAMNIARVFNGTVRPPRISLCINRYSYLELKKEVNKFFREATIYYKKMGIEI